MFSRSRLVLLAFGAVLVLMLAWAILHAPPDGTEHGELSQFVGRFHPLAVPLPIARLLLVPLLEFLGLCRHWTHFRNSEGFPLIRPWGWALAARCPDVPFGMATWTV